MISYEQPRELFHARHLAVPIELAYTLETEMLAEDGARLLTDRNFEQAPVRRDGELVGFVLRSQLECNLGATVGDLTTALGSGNIVSADAPVDQLLQWITDPGFLFVLSGREFAGFVTVSDFNKQPAQAYLYLLLATFETGLSDLMRRRFADDQAEVFRLMDKEDAIETRSRFAADQLDNVEADPIAYLGFSQLLNVVTRSQELRKWIGVSRTAWKGDSGSLVELRNSAMYPARILVQMKDGLLRLRRQEERLRQLSDLVTAALIEHPVATLDIRA